jgi:hypothetical protein
MVTDVLTHGINNKFKLITPIVFTSLGQLGWQLKHVCRARCNLQNCFVAAWRSSAQQQNHTVSTLISQSMRAQTGESIYFYFYTHNWPQRPLMALVGFRSQTLAFFCLTLPHLNTI